MYAANAHAYVLRAFPLRFLHFGHYVQQTTACVHKIPV